MGNTFKVLALAAFAVELHSLSFAQKEIEEWNSWVYLPISKMYKAGFLVGYPESNHRRPGISRYELAVAVYATSEHVHGILEHLQKEVDAPSSDKKARAQLAEDLRNIRVWDIFIRDLRMLAIHFRPELRELVGYKKTIDMIEEDDLMTEKLRLVKFNPDS